jgi:hypothetical protein
LIGGNLRGVGHAISLSRGTLQTILQNLFWAFFYNIFLIPIAAFGLLMPMIAAGAMAFSSIFVVTNSLRLRGYKVQTIQPQKPLWRQLAELTPHLAMPAAALVLLIALSVGWLQPVRAGQNKGSAQYLTTYRLFIDQSKPITAGSTTPLNIKVLDQFGNLFTDFEFNNYYKSIYYAHLAVVPRNLSSLTETPLLLDPYRTTNVVRSNMGSGTGSGMGSGMGANTGANSAIGPLVSFSNAVIQPKVVFPKDGQYIAFVEFWPRGGERVVLSYPLIIGAGPTSTPDLSPDTDSIRQVGNLTVNMKTDGALKAGQFNYVTFETRDDQGQIQSQKIAQLSGSHLGLFIVDEAATTFLRPDFIKRNDLQFSVWFPKPGRYKAWFEFTTENTIQQISYVLDVK